MGRLRFWLRWSARDLRGRWVLVVAIALVIAIGTGIYSGLGSMENWRKASNDASFAALNAHDLELSLTEGTFARTGELDRIAASIPDRARIAAAEERLVVPSQVAVDRSGAAPLVVPGQVVGAADVSANATDAVDVSSGHALPPPDGARSAAVLEQTFGAAHELPASGSLRLGDGRRLDYVGQGTSPEYFLVTRPGGGEFGGAEASFAVVFTSLETAQRAVGGGATVNDLVIRLAPGADPGAVTDQLRAGLEARGLAGEISTQADETAHRILYKDAEGDQQLFNIFAVLILAGAALATFNLATRIVEAQRREIGIGMALGVPARELAIRPLLLGVQIAIAGVVCGTVLGLLAGDLFRGVLEDLLPLPETVTPFEFGVFARGALLGLVLPIIATAIPVWRGVRLAPIEAIRVGFRSARSSGVAGLAARLRLPGSTIAQLPLRNVLRAPRRTMMTALGIAAVVTVVVAFLGFVDSFLATVDRSEAEVEQTAPDRVSISLDRFEAEDGPAVRAVAHTDGIAATQASLQLPATFRSADGSFAGSITMLDFSGPVWAPTITEGRSPRPGESGIVIAEEAARDLGVGIGDRIEVVHPVRAAGGGFAEDTTPATVTGLHPDPFRIFAYADISAAAAAGMGGMINRIAVDPRPGTTADELSRELFGTPGIASVERASATIDFVRDRLNDFIGVIQLTVGFALALALLIAFNSASISTDERARENATMLAFGVPARDAVGLAIGESLITGLIGTLIGIGGGLLVIGWVVNQTLPETLPDLGLVVSISGGSILIAALVGVLAVAIAPLLTARRLRRMDVPSTLRVVE